MLHKTLLNDHLSPKPIVIAERFRFHKRDQKEGESITVYVAEFRENSRNTVNSEELLMMLCVIDLYVELKMKIYRKSFSQCPI